MPPNMQNYRHQGRRAAGADARSVLRSPPLLVVPVTAVKFGSSLCNIRCECGHEADIEEFCSTPVSGELPAGTYQCPRCSVAWRVGAEFKFRWSTYKQGVIVPVQSVL